MRQLSASRSFLTCGGRSGSRLSWLLIENRMPEGRSDIDVAAVRIAAAKLSGALPATIEVETVSHTQVPHIARVSGTDWSQMDTPRNVYRVVFPAGCRPRSGASTDSRSRRIRQCSKSPTHSIAI